MTLFVSGLRSMYRELSVVNRLIVAIAGKDVPVEMRYSFPVGIFTKGDEGPARSMSSDLGKGATSASGCPRLRYYFSLVPLHSAASKAIGARRARKASYADARFVWRIPSWVTVGDANKPMMNIMIGSGFAAVCATGAARRSPSCRLSPRLTAITA